MKQSILQYLINDISAVMLKTADNDNRGTREKCFKDLKVSELDMKPIIKSAKTGKWLIKLKSTIRGFDWEDSFSFRTRNIADVLRQEAAEVKTQRLIQTKTNVNGLYYIVDNHTLALVLDSLDDLDLNPLELANCVIPQEMASFNLTSMSIEVSHPYVKGFIKVIIRNKKK